MNEGDRRRAEPRELGAGGASGARESLTADELRAHSREISAALSARAPAWGAKRSSFSGRSPAIRVEIELREGRPRPPAADLWIPLPSEIGGRLKVFVVDPSGGGLHRPQFFANSDYSAVTDPIAPGAQILIPSGASWSAAGVAAVVTLSGQPHLLTCSHAFNGPADVYVRGESEPIATMSKAYLDDAQPLDAAVCELNSFGITLLERSTRAETWFRSVHAPEPGDNGVLAVFWPTSVGNDGPYEIDIQSYWSSTSVLFPTGDMSGLIQIPTGVIGGDSGSILALNGEYYGLCSGNVEGRWSFFTPVAAAIERLQYDYGEVALWVP